MDIKKFGFINDGIDKLQGSQESQKPANSEQSAKVEAVRDVQKIKMDAQKLEDKLVEMDFE